MLRKMVKILKDCTEARKLEGTERISALLALKSLPCFRVIFLVPAPLPEVSKNIMPSETAPKVSVLMPAYNAADTIAQAAPSLMEQTLAGWECVIVDDGSTDGTAAALEALAAGDHRFAPLRLDGHCGLVAALNAGLARCRGAYVARMDADDRAGRRRLEAQAVLLDQDPRLTLVSCLVRGFSDNGPVPEGMSAYEEWLNSVITHEDIVRDLFVENPPIEEIVARLYAEGAS